MAFPSLRNKERKRAGLTITKQFISSVFKVELGSHLQCVQGLSTPTGLSLHIHYVWLQLHHLLLQFTDLGLDTHMGFIVFNAHVTTSYTHT